MNTQVMFSSKKMDCTTPTKFFNDLDNRFNFQWDLAATEDNTKVKNHFITPEMDSLSDAWPWHKLSGWLWCNPPYGRGIGNWIKKAYDEAQLGAHVIMLVPARTDTRWFHQYCYNNEYCHIEFIAGRLKFDGLKNAAPFPSMLLIFYKQGAPI